MHLALFELDCLLAGGDGRALWNTWMITQGWLGATRETPGGSRDLVRPLWGDADPVRSFAPLAGHRIETVQARLRALVADQLLPRLLPRAQEQIARHRARGDILMMVSPAPCLLVAPIAEHLDIAYVIAVEPEIHDGCFTGATRGVLADRGGKVRCLQAWQRQQGMTPRRTTYYARSRNDLPLLARVEEAVAVDPDPVLAEVARFEGWPRLDWRRSLHEHEGWPARLSAGA